MTFVGAILAWALIEPASRTVHAAESPAPADAPADAPGLHGEDPARELSAA